MEADDITLLLLQLAVLLAVARVVGEVVQRWHQPAVLGELLAGILLGPTLLGRLLPNWLFPVEGPTAIALEGITTLAIVLFLLVAGIEVDLSTIWRQGTTSLKVGLAGILLPFVVGLVAAGTWPDFFDRGANVDATLFALFFATALSISALPVIAKSLMDLNLFRSDLGMVIISAAIFNDVIGWIIFGVILGLIGEGDAELGNTPVWAMVLMTLGFAAAMLTVGRAIIHRTLPWLHAYAHWPGGVISFAVVLALLGGAVTQWIGIHAIFGSFLVGVAIGDSPHLRERTRTIIDEFVSFIFAPLFFASIGLHVDFVAAFDLPMVLVVFVIACFGKVIGCSIGARWGAMPWRESWAVGFGMNARGAMEIILALLALRYELIGEQLFVALVVMALGTSMMSGSMMQRVLGKRKTPRLRDYLSPKGFVRPLMARDRQEAVRELSGVAADIAGIAADRVAEAVWNRESVKSTAQGAGVAVPHARLGGFRTPVVAVGISPEGIDFDAPDGEPVHLIFLVLTPPTDEGLQLDAVTEIVETFPDRTTTERALQVKGFVEFLAIIRGPARQEPKAGRGG